MVYRKVTPAIEKFVQNNCTLPPNVLVGLIDKEFSLKITSRAIYPYLQRARAESIAVNDAKVEAVRARILGDGGLQAGKYLKYLDENIESLNLILKSANGIKIETTRDYVAVSQALLRSLSTVLGFVKPSPSFREDWAELRSEILDAVDDLPEAKSALVAVLEKRRSLDENVTGER